MIDPVGAWLPVTCQPFKVHVRIVYYTAILMKSLLYNFCIVSSFEYSSIKADVDSETTKASCLRVIIVMIARTPCATVCSLDWTLVSDSTTLELLAGVHSMTLVQLLVRGSSSRSTSCVPIEYTYKTI